MDLLQNNTVYQRFLLLKDVILNFSFPQKISGISDSLYSDGAINMLRIALAAFSTAYNFCLYVMYNPNFRTGLLVLFGFRQALQCCSVRVSPSIDSDPTQGQPDDWQQRYLLVSQLHCHQQRKDEWVTQLTDHTLLVSAHVCQHTHTYWTYAYTIVTQRDTHIACQLVRTLSKVRWSSYSIENTWNTLDWGVWPLRTYFLRKRRGLPENGTRDFSFK